MRHFQDCIVYGDSKHIKFCICSRPHRSASIKSVAMSKQRLPVMISKFPATRDISHSNIFNVHNPGKARTESFFYLNTAHVLPSIFSWKFFFICIVLSYLTVDTAHHTHLYTVCVRVTFWLMLVREK